MRRRDIQKAAWVGALSLIMFSAQGCADDDGGSGDGSNAAMTTGSDADGSTNADASVDDSGGAQSDAGSPQDSGAAPDSTTSTDTAAPDPDTTAPDPDADMLDGGAPDTEAPRDTDTTEPDAAEPDAAEPDAAEPDAAEPDVSEPDVSEPEGACANVDDEAALASSQATLSETITGCVFECLGQMGPECVTGCMERGAGLTTDCAVCFAGTVECTLANCAFLCLDAESQACGECQAENCDADFEACSGIAPVR